MSESSSKGSSVPAKITETAKEEAKEFQKQTAAALRSGAYFYPFKGIAYLFSHRSLWKPLLSRLAPTMGLGLTITTFMFLFTYLPQLAVLVFTSGPVAAVTTILLVLSESSTLTMVLSKALLIEDALIDTFDGTLVARGETALVEKERQVKGGSAGDSIARLGKLVSKPFQKFTPSAVIRYFMYLPLNFIPVVGTVIFVLLQGKKFGPNAHSRYFQLKNMSKLQKEKHVEERRGAYTGFGVSGVVLEMVPIAGILFAFTNTCAAALWAADMEQAAGSSPELRDQAKKAA
ncbi:hypothetical protein LTR37_017496 [Vermiconidia calcicola]|uniref:Uncharacterized protein n=1 Tax=Vermiconidia calcicola TaxID=1690605 RepID=A0ACC3MKR4_9PEZI|nr:hypothetical protein LTR37_017496 [Vermiconidia calcicola]